MPMWSTPDMLVVLDEHPSSVAGLRIAQRYAHGTVALASWGAAVDPDTEVVTSVTSEPTVDEAFRIAVQRRIGTVLLRRDLNEPHRLLADLLVAAARRAHDDQPGFVVFLADGEPGPFRRILAVVDQRGGAISGMLAYAGVAMADMAGAVLDILVIGANGRDLHAEDERAMLTVSRELELYDRAVRRGRDSGITVNWIPASGVSDPWTVIADQLSQHPYDLVIDDLGDVALGGRRGVRRTTAAALSPGEVGAIPLRLLSEVRVPLMLVIDEIRLGIAPLSLLKAGTAAALALGLVSTGAVSATSTAAATAGPARTPEELVLELEQALGVQPTDTGDRTDAAERAADATDASRGGVEPGARAAVLAASMVTVRGDIQASADEKARSEADKRGSQEPPPPEEVDARDLRRAQSQERAARSAYRKDRTQQEEAQQRLEKAHESLDSATTHAQAALADLRAAQAWHDQAAAHAQKVQADVTGVTGVLPGGATPEQATTSAHAEQYARERLEQATTAGRAALTELKGAEAELATAEETLADRQSEVAQARAEVRSSKEKVSDYRESLAETRQPPVAKGHYRLTARFGQSGWNWSSGVHTGLDFAGSHGTDVMAAASGTVASTGWAGAYGNQIVIEHADGYQTTYNHLSGIRVSAGQEVSTGEHIGEMGSTGNSTGTHLHFEVLRNDKFLDPEEWLGW